jgi:uncharacterized membrane protein
MSPKSAATVSAFCVLITVGASACGDRDIRPNDSASIAPRDTIVDLLTAEPLRALGTEPFWALDVDGAGLRFITPEDTSGIRFPPIAATAVADTVVWSGQTERATIELRVWREKCSDGMSDREYPYASRVTVAGTTYRGCADRRRSIAPPGPRA